MNRTESTSHARATHIAHGEHPRAALLAALPLTEHTRELAGIRSAVLEGGNTAPDARTLVLLHGPGGYAAHWMRIIPVLAERHRLIVPDLPAHGRTESGGHMGLERALAWLEALVEQSGAEPPVLIGELLGGALALRFTLRHPNRVRQLVLVDTFGLCPFQPTPEFGQRLMAFGAQPGPDTHRRLWQHCARDLDRLRERLGPLWEPFEAYNIERARAPETRDAQQALMAEIGMAALPEHELAELSVPTALIWGRHDLATPVAVAEAASERFGWPLQVIEDANDAPAMEQPEDFVRALERILGSAAPAGSPPRQPRRSNGHEEIDTLVIGGGQAGLATSYWLTQKGIEHLVLERRPELGGSWPDRWDSFHLVSPNFCLLLPGMPYAGADPDAFMPRDQVIEYVRTYAAHIAAPVRLGRGVERLSAANGGFEAQTGDGTLSARRVVLATGPAQRPKIPALSRALPARIQQLHSNDYRRPAQLPDGAVLVVGSGQSGTQIAEELEYAGRRVHLALSRCPSAPRRYRGRDLIWWLLHTFLEGEAHGVRFPTVGDLPSPAARFACNPILSGTRGGHDIRLRDFARRGIRLHGHLEAVDGERLHFSDDLAERLDFADHAFDQKFRPLFDAFAAAARVDAPVDDRPPPDDFMPPVVTELDLDRAGITSVIWATGYRLDFGWVDLPVFDEWSYPRHVRGVSEYPGLYAVGLPWLYSEPSAVIAGVGLDAEHVVEHLAQHRLEAAQHRAEGQATP